MFLISVEVTARERIQLENIRESVRLCVQVQEFPISEPKLKIYNFPVLGHHSFSIAYTVGGVSRLNTVTQRQSLFRFFRQMSHTGTHRRVLFSLPLCKVRT